MHKSIIYLKTNWLLQLIIVITFLLFNATSSKAQLNDTTKVNLIDTTKALPKKFHSPRKATLMSTFCPGLGQIYNKKYWKVPVIYAGFGALAYSINYNQNKYKTYLNAYKDALNGVPDAYTNLYANPENLNSLQHYFHRYRDLSVIGVLALYLLNVVDASVDAHLFSFDVSENLSLNIHPTLINTAYVNHYQTGVSLNIKF